ncbi:MAG: signal recognition particle-docking protein FtsY [Acidiferrobacterales bacterium]|nr:signal recognition particle-docking protein FtsY [Acidiferrobacterales bacterium]
MDDKQASSGFGRFFKRNKEPQSKVVTNSDSVARENTDRYNTVEQGLDKTRSSLLSKIGDVFKGTFDLEDELFEDLEEVLMSCDIGVKASLGLVDNLRERVEREKIKDAAGVITGLQNEIAELLKDGEEPWGILGDTAAPLSGQKPYVILMVGVNGVGKTTTTAKIAYKLQQQGKSVMLAAADTFRAAAVEQLQSWGERLNIPVIAQQSGADAAAVAHDALSSALARNADVLLIDTAGRLHTQSDLMEQLQKITRVLKKIDPNYPHEVMQILDAGTGQNALVQLEHFQKAVGVSSICLTKLDGSAKGGVAIALTQQYKLPIRFIGLGESFDDLQPFDSHAFAQALISNDLANNS